MNPIGNLTGFRRSDITRAGSGAGLKGFPHFGEGVVGIPRRSGRRGIPFCLDEKADGGKYVIEADILGCSPEWEKV